MMRTPLALVASLALTLAPLVPFVVPHAAAAATVASAATLPLPATPAGVPLTRVDLATEAGLAQLGGAWRYADARIVETSFRAVGPDLKPSGPPNRTYDVEPHAGIAAFDDSSWPVIAPTSLAERRGNGKVSFNWYRLRLTVPERLNGIPTEGTTLVFETTVDDYAEVWVDGALVRDLGQSGGSVVAGFNVPNRLVVGREVHPGQTIQIALFGINGPISAAPENYIWIRSATLVVYNTPRAVEPAAVALQVERLDPALDAILPANAHLERLATGFRFTEGPIGLREGGLLFSDPNENRIYRWDMTNGLRIFRDASGYSGADIAEYGQPGSNGLTFDREGRLTICEHGNHRISRLERNGTLTVLADSFEGKRLNSPNDLVYRSDGTLYFTDPPFGLPKFYDDPRKELDFSGVYCLKDGRLTLQGRDLIGPNGLAFSPDERFLYVTNWDPKKKVVMRYAVRPDGGLEKGTLFFDMTAAPGEEALDGVKVDQRGNLYVSGPGGLWILSPDGRHLGTLRGPELAANMAWGGDDGRTLYWAARSGIYRLRLNVTGNPPDTSLSERLPR